jgi:DNA mismatch repair protein MutS
MTKKVAETPLMQQYNTIKAKYADAILLFRVGDFYETFSTDAITTAKVLGITLTKRGAGSPSEVELAGFPHHAMDTYLPKLVRAGYRVAICDQLEDPKMTKTIVKRGVTELVTPGVALNDNILENKQNNFLCSIFLQDKNAGVAFLDISTGEFLTAQGTVSYIEKLVQSFVPNEIIYPRNAQKEFNKHFSNKFYSYPQDEWVYTSEYTYDMLVKHFEVNSLKGFGIEEMNLAIIASGATLQYVKSTEHNRLQHINKITKIDEEQYVSIDKFTIRNLEILQGSQQGATSLVDVLDYTITSMGARMLKRFLMMPLKNISSIQERLDIIEEFSKDEKFTKQIAEQLKQVGDLERLISKVSTGKISPRDINQLKKSLKATSQIKQLFYDSKIISFKKWEEQLQHFPLLIDKIEQEINEEAPALLNKGNVIKAGANSELDELRDIISNSKDYLLKIQNEEAEKTGISSLKIGFNNVFGYFLEVTNVHKTKVPNEWIRKQTLSNAERYITEELKVLEQKILGAEEKIQVLEESIFNKLLVFVQDYIMPIQNNAIVLSKIDVLYSAFFVAQKNIYCKPTINDTLALSIVNGRHPMIENQLGHDKEYIPNDIVLDCDTLQIMMITGPNMSGKSAVLRQTALIVLMAQCGFYVPASQATIGIVDKIFTRVGASDNMSSGESTFMVEMNETASIVNNISSRSLILLDEIGRGTSTYDGISIAWSIAEFLHDYPNAKPKTLFATHYHELNELATNYPRIKNYHVATKEVGDKVLFLRKLVEGGSEHSFGIHVAKMAGMPKPIVDRANELLVQLEKKSLATEKDKIKNIKKTTQYQLNIFESSNPKASQVLELLEKVDINTLTPVDALWKLNELKKMME